MVQGASPLETNPNPKVINFSNLTIATPPEREETNRSRVGQEKKYVPQKFLYKRLAYLDISLYSLRLLSTVICRRPTQHTRFNGTGWFSHWVANSSVSVSHLVISKKKSKKRKNRPKWIISPTTPETSSWMTTMSHSALPLPRQEPTSPPCSPACQPVTRSTQA